eukprot:10464116-Karenia_brevis.AAC.1
MTRAHVSTGGRKGPALRREGTHVSTGGRKGPADFGWRCPEIRNELYCNHVLLVPFAILWT